MTTGIKSNVKLKQAKFSPDEIAITEKLAKNSYVTFARTDFFKGVRYAFVHCYPPNEIKELLHINKHLLIIFLDTAYTDRTGDFIDKIIEEYRSRVDSRMVLLISKEHDIKNKIKDNTKDYHDSRPIIPYVYEELLHENTYSSAIWEKITEKVYEFYNVDLFDFLNPIKTSFNFFGRTEEINELYGRYLVGENGGLFGLRKIGKTSVINALNRKLKMEDKYGIYFDCSFLHHKRWYELLGHITNEIATEIKKRDNIKIDVSEKYDEKYAAELFKKHIIRINESIKKERILLTFDEVENITFDISPQEHWAKGTDYTFFWQAIRAMQQLKPNIFSFIIAGTNPKIIEEPSASGSINPIFSGVNIYYLPFFKLAEVEDMVSAIGGSMGLKFDKEIYIYLMDDFGGHPLITRQACSILKKESRRQNTNNIDKHTYSFLKKDFDEKLFPYVQLVLGVLENYPEEYYLLERLALEDYSAFFDVVNSSQNLLQHLKGYNLIAHKNNNYFITIEAVKKYLVNISSIPKKDLSLEEKWSICATRRGKIEQSLRLMIYQVTTRYHENTAMEKFMNSINSDSRKNDYKKYSLTELFGDRSPLHFSDLTNFIDSEWKNSFNRIFNNKTLFTVYSQVINQTHNGGRAEAHALQLNEEGFNLVITAFNWFEKNISYYTLNGN